MSESSHNLEVTPFPPRYWWLKRISLGTLVVLGVLAIFRFAIGVYAQRRFDAHVAELRARGEPTRPEDLAAPEMTDEENAAFHLQNAANVAVAAGVDSPRSSNLEFRHYLPYPPEWWKAAEGSFKAKTAAFASVRKARTCAQSAFPRPTKSGMLFTFIGYNGQRELANSLADAAEYLHRIGDHQESLELTRDLLYQADAITAEPLLVSSLVGKGIQGVALFNLTLIAPGLSISDTPDGKSATRAQMKELIAYLMDNARDKRAIRQTLLTERVAIFDTIETTFTHSLLLRPAYQIEYRRGIDRFNATFAGADADTWPAARDAMRAKQSQSPVADRRKIGISTALSILLPSMDRAMEINYRYRLSAHVAAVSLAAQLFKHDHDRWPATLDEMVPVYLPSVPTDPMAADGGPLRYVMVGDRPIAFSVGEDGVPQPDPAARVPATPSYGWINYRRTSAKKDDQYFDLSRFTPSAAATQASEE